MNRPMKDDILGLLPELFDKKNKTIAPDGMCTPGSGCAPTSKTTETNILKILTGSDPSSPSPKRGIDKTADSAATSSVIEHITSIKHPN